MPSPEQFNDPFDCLPPADVPANIDDWNERKEAFYDRLHQSAGEISRAEVAQTVDAIIDQHGLAFLNDVSKVSFANGGARMGVFCLTENVRSVLMWSHYANHHRGIAIRFSFTDPLYDERMTLFRVRYQEERAILPAFFGGGDQADAIMAALCTKAEFWSYEKEWRFLEPDGAGTIIEIDPRIISGVVLGAKTSHSDACWIADLCAVRNIPLMKVRPDDRTFALNFHEARDPRKVG